MPTIILRNGRLLDPGGGMDQVCDLELSDGQIRRMGQLSPEAGTLSVDASGCLVVPGLIDFHTHLFKGGSAFGFHSDLLFSAGVTTAVDAGTAGATGYETFYMLQQGCAMPWFAFLNLSSMGQVGGGINEDLDPSLVDEGRIKALFARYPEKLVGLKVRISRGIVRQWGDAPLTKALALAEQLGTRLCVHSTDPCIPMAELAERLRPGDILCHVYHGKGSTILDETGALYPQLRQAAERGVILDAANGRSNFDFSVAQAAIDQGLLPSIISSDLTAATVFQGDAANSLLFLLSKYLNMGLGLSDVLRAATTVPAACLGQAGRIGTLAAGSAANVTVLSLVQRPVRFRDSAGKTLDGDRVFVPRLTLLNGQPMFDDNSLPRTYL